MKITCNPASLVFLFSTRLSALQGELAKHERRNWLFAGSMLGWYRQCSIIPHDRDLDTATWIEDFDDWMIPYFAKHPVVPIYVKFGRKDDSLEFKMGNKLKRTIDLFWVFPGPGKDQVWSGFQTFDGKYTKKYNFFPAFREICATDLHDYLVYVPCNAKSIIEFQYGKDAWYKPNQKYNYRYANNSHVNGTWTAKQWKSGEVYKLYQ